MVVLAALAVLVELYDVGGQEVDAGVDKGEAHCDVGLADSGWYRVEDGNKHALVCEDERCQWWGVGFLLFVVD